MNYLGRPVFSWEVDWGSPINKAFNYDSKEALVGFGSEVFSPMQAHVAQGFIFSVLLESGEAIAAMDAFTTGLLGRLNGFWLPAPLDSGQIVSRISATQFTIRECGLTETWDQNPDIHLAVCSPGDPDGLQAGRIAAVASAGGGLERVTLQAGMDPWPAPGMILSRMHYVRLADNVERGRFLAEGMQQREFTVLELPEEYEAAETGQRPIYLYHFWCDAPGQEHWYFTSFAADVVSNGIRYEARPITHGAVRNTLDAQASLRLTMAYQDDCPLLLFLPTPLARPMNVQVSMVDYADPNTATALFTGQVRLVTDDGEQLAGECDAFANVIRRKAPMMLIQPQCPYFLYDARTCKAAQRRYETSGVISANHPLQRPPTVDLDLAWPASAHAEEWQSADWFAHGYIETGFKTNYEAVSVIGSAYAGGKLTLTLSTPLNKAAAGQWAQLVPGCDRSPATCAAKFGNFVNFGGFLDVPLRNPALKAMTTNVSSGGKK